MRQQRWDLIKCVSIPDLDVSSRYASSNVLAAVPPGTPRAVSHEDITR